MAVKGIAVMHNNVSIFLSRLCGGEEGANLQGANLQFLSRLCGGEGASPDRLVGDTFLSRLCGGEEPITRLVRFVALSKPPMWR